MQQEVSNHNKITSTRLKAQPKDERCIKKLGRHNKDRINQVASEAEDMVKERYNKRLGQHNKITLTKLPAKHVRSRSRSPTTATKITSTMSL